MNSKRIKVNLIHGEGSIVYDISHINREWEKLVQQYERVPDYFDDDKLIFQSDFTLFLQQSTSPDNFADYLSEQKQRLWKELFELKRFYLRSVRPDAVKHLIDKTIIEKRYKLYGDLLEMPGEYEVARDTHYVWFLKT